MRNEAERTSVAGRTRRSARGRAALLGLCLLASGCRVEALDTVPPYPGATAGPGYRVAEKSVTSLKQVYHTTDDYERVVEFYAEYTAREPGWERGAPGGERGSPGGHAGSQGEPAVWRRNMQPEQGLAAARPVDPGQPGKLIVVLRDGSRTTIRAFTSHPRR